MSVCVWYIISQIPFQERVEPLVGHEDYDDDDENDDDDDDRCDDDDGMVIDLFLAGSRMDSLSNCIRSFASSEAKLCQSSTKSHEKDGFDKLQSAIRPFRKRVDNGFVQ